MIQIMEVKKTMTSQIGTFKKTKGDALLGNFAELITSSKVSKTFSCRNS